MVSKSDFIRSVKIGRTLIKTIKENKLTEYFYGKEDIDDYTDIYNFIVENITSSLDLIGSTKQRSMDYLGNLLVEQVSYPMFVAKPFLEFYDDCLEEKYI